jgi:type IV pilus biogenesis protein CpaD/CtpE
MRAVVPVLFGAMALAGCGDPNVDQAKIDTRHDPVRADTMLAVNFPPGIGRLDGGQVEELRAMVVAARHAQRAEFVVVTDGSGGPLQQARAQQVKLSLSTAGARWVGLSLEPAMAMGPDTVVVARQEYKIGERNCPDGDSGAMWNPTETAGPGYGCADAYNQGQMMARPADAASGRPMGPADATVNAAAIERYRQGRVRSADASGSSSGSGGSGASTITGSSSSSTN